MPKLQLAVVIPVYNEEACIAQVLGDWTAALDELKIDYRIIALNDGSRDRTQEILGEMPPTPRLELVDKPNSGHGPTILMGYRSAVQAAEWVFQCDSDNEMPASHFKRLWEIRDSYDALFGFRTGRKSSIDRKIVSFLSRLVAGMLFGTGVKDVNVPYRLIRAEILEKIISDIPPDTFAPNIIISGMLCKSGAKIANIPVPHVLRKTGKVSIGNIRLWKFSFQSLVQTLKYKL